MIRNFCQVKILTIRKLSRIHDQNCKTPDSKSESSKELNKCEGLKLSEIASNVDEQFIEIINSGEKTVITTGCKLTVGDSGVRENIGDIELNPGEFLTIKIKNTKLKLPKQKEKFIY